MAKSAFQQLNSDDSGWFVLGHPVSHRRPTSRPKDIMSVKEYVAITMPHSQRGRTMCTPPTRTLEPSRSIRAQTRLASAVDFGLSVPACLVSSTSSSPSLLRGLLMASISNFHETYHKSVCKQTKGYTYGNKHTIAFRNVCMHKHVYKLVIMLCFYTYLRTKVNAHKHVKVHQCAQVYIDACIYIYI